MADTQMEIFDAYVENLTEQARAKEKKVPKPGAGGSGPGDKRSTTSELQVGVMREQASLLPSLPPTLPPSHPITWSAQIVC